MFLALSVRSTYFLDTLYIQKIILRVSENFWYKLEQRTTHTDGYFAAESHFYQFLKNDTPKRNFKMTILLKKTVKIQNSQNSKSSKIF